jgi:hypothetical protein
LRSLIKTADVDEIPLLEVKRYTMSGIGSYDGTMDMMQLVLLLMIPVLREAQDDEEGSDSPDRKNENDLIVCTVEMLLHDATESC